MYTGAPVPSARSATPPRWSQWPWVTRIATHSGAAPGQLEADLGRVRARIDDHGFGRARVPDEVAVRPDRTELEARNVKGHQAAESIFVRG